VGHRAGRLSEVRFHDLRDTGNTLAAWSGVSTRDLMSRMGHDSMRSCSIERPHRFGRAPAWTGLVPPFPFTHLRPCRPETPLPLGPTTTQLRPHQCCQPIEARHRRHRVQPQVTAVPHVPSTAHPGDLTEVVALKVGGSSPLGHPRSERSWAPSGRAGGHSLSPVVARRPRDRGTRDRGAVRRLSRVGAANHGGERGRDRAMRAAIGLVARRCRIRRRIHRRRSVNVAVRCPSRMGDGPERARSTPGSNRATRPTSGDRYVASQTNWSAWRRIRSAWAESNRPCRADTSTRSASLMRQCWLLGVTTTTS
jgi:hypothetical protein